MQADPIAHQLDANGVQVTGSNLRIDFGRSYDSAVASMSKLVGRQPDTAGQCPDDQAQFVDWPDGTRLVFLPSKGFVGWEKQGSAAGVSCRRTEMPLS